MLIKDVMHSSLTSLLTRISGSKSSKTTRSSIAGRTRSNNNGSAAAVVSSYSLYPNTANTNRGSTPNGVTEGGGSAGRDHRNGVV
jgi:hypothetical protein